MRGDNSNKILDAGKQVSSKGPCWSKKTIPGRQWVKLRTNSFYTLNLQ